MYSLQSLTSADKVYRTEYFVSRRIYFLSFISLMPPGWRLNVICSTIRKMCSRQKRESPAQFTSGAEVGTLILVAVITM